MVNVLSDYSDQRLLMDNWVEYGTDFGVWILIVVKMVVYYWSLFVENFFSKIRLFLIDDLINSTLPLSFGCFNPNLLVDRRIHLKRVHLIPFDLRNSDCFLTVDAHSGKRILKFKQIFFESRFLLVDIRLISLKRVLVSNCIKDIIKSGLDNITFHLLIQVIILIDETKHLIALLVKQKNLNLMTDVVLALFCN